MNAVSPPPRPRHPQSGFHGLARLAPGRCGHCEGNRPLRPVKPALTRSIHEISTPVLLDGTEITTYDWITTNGDSTLCRKRSAGALLVLPKGPFSAPPR